VGNARRTILIQITDDPKAPNGVAFSMAGFGVKKDQITCSKAGMNKNEPNKVVFEIDNQSTRDWLFPSDEANAIWVGANADDCPKSLPPENPEFPVKKMKVSEDRERLSVDNLNTCEADYKFCLNFVEAGDRNQKLCPYDPIWNNQNGGTTRFGP